MGQDVLADCERLYSLMRRFWLGVNPRLKDALLQGQINMAQYNALVALQKLGEGTMGDLAGLLQVTMGAATNLVDKLVDSGCAERRRDESDRRVVKVRITPKGRTVLDDRAQGFLDYAVGILSQVSPEEREVFLSIYDKIVDLTEAEARGEGASSSDVDD
ncbi:MAG TPA: MarR family winged helix-turn-helix transcriptional regulator [Planctomycetota bacterium]|nr:MarR family winged helix-turn-helix transcriptional regulator [Planctomycetota bacterium]